MIIIDVRANVTQAQKNLTALARTQIPYAVALALTETARDVQLAEKKALPHIFDRPTPFTVNSIRIIPARKNAWYATVYIMDTAAEYLYPYEVGGKAKLIGKGVTWLEPKDYSLLNQYGNFPAHTLERLVGSGNAGVGDTRTSRGLKPFPGKPGVFIGTVHTKKGPVGGVWKRISKGGRQARGLKLLIRFGDEKPAKQHLDFGKRAQAVVSAQFNKRFGQSLGRALATMKP